MHLDNVTIQGQEMPRTAHGNLPTSDPASTTYQAAVGEAHGRVPENEQVCVEVGDAGTVTIFIYSPASNNWRKPGSATSSHQKTFAAAGFDYFSAPRNALFYVRVNTGTVPFWTNGRAKS